MSVALAGVLGVALGALIGIVALRRSAATRADALFRAWRAEESRRISAEAADAQRLDLKAELAGPVDVAFLAADARWLGDPVPLVVFDGDSEIKAGAAETLRVVSFVASGHHPCPSLALVQECVDSGRVRWLTVRTTG